MLGFKEYNYRHFTRDILREISEASLSGPKPGDEAPNFKARVLDGGELHLGEFRGKKNVLLVFGSATCPMTAGAMAGINELYSEYGNGEVEFLLIYTREAHPGERIPAHSSFDRKARSARVLRDQESIKMPVVVDDLRGSIHRKYSPLPNPAFLIDKSGRVAFRCMWASPEKLSAAIEELLAVQQERGVDRAVVAGGQDSSMPLGYRLLFSYRALERGGEQALNDFRAVFDVPGRTAIATSRISESILAHPGRILAVVALSTAVLAGGLYAGFELRKRRLIAQRNPYRAYEKEEVRDTETGTEYGAVGI